MGVDFTNLAMIGRQSFQPDQPTCSESSRYWAFSVKRSDFIRENKYAEPFFALLGAKKIVSVDASNYENATHVHDMNRPIPEELRERFSVVHDGGTLEHVFNFPQALKNCMEMVKVGGHFTQVNEANNFMGHGFWQLSPELIYRAFSPANGYQVEAVLLHEVVPGGAWYLAVDPDKVQRRVELCNSRPTYILTIARRVAIADIFEPPPQQSDYVTLWNSIAETDQQTVRPPEPARHPRGLRRFLPRPVKRVLRSVVEGFRRLKKVPAFDPACYRRIEESALLRGQFA